MRLLTHKIIVLLFCLSFGPAVFANSWRVGVDFEAASQEPSSDLFTSNFTKSLGFYTGYEFSTGAVLWNLGLSLSVCPCDLSVRDQAQVDYLGWGSFLGMGLKATEVWGVELIPFAEAHFQLKSAESHQSFEGDLEDVVDSSQALNISLTSRLIKGYFGIEFRRNMVGGPKKPITRVSYVFLKMGYTQNLYSKVQANVELFDGQEDEYDYEHKSQGVLIQSGVGFSF